MTPLVRKMHPVIAVECLVICFAINLAGLSRSVEESFEMGDAGGRGRCKAISQGGP
jgi:hypothetical protein